MTPYPRDEPCAALERQLQLENPADAISHMCGHHLPFLSCLIPLYMVKCLCSWRDTLAIWPAALLP